MNFSIITKYPLWFILFCVALGGIYALVLYRKNKKLKEFSISLIRLLAALRFVVVSVLAFLLLSPFIKQLNRIVEQPILVLALDNSQSIVLGNDSTELKQRYSSEVEHLTSALGEDFELNVYTFGESLNESDSLNFNQQQTDLSAVLNGVESRFTNRNVGALILASDGIYNKGSNPKYTSFAANYPIYSIALGDTSVQRDAQLAKVVANKIAYLGNQFPIAIQINAQQLNGKSTALSIYNQGKKIYSAPIKYTSNDFFEEHKAVLDAKVTGLQKYTVEISVVDSEQNTINNSTSIYVDVLDGREKIQLLANAPHPDIAAIKRAIEQNENYEVEVALFDQFDGKAADANLIIYHNLPAKATDVAKIQQLKSNASLFIVGQQTNIPSLNDLSTGLSIKSIGRDFNEVTPILNSTFPLFTISEETAENLIAFPPVAAPFGKLSTSVSTYPLLKQKIGGVTTESSQWFFLQEGNTKTGFILGEGVWRWSLADYQKNQTKVHFEELMSKTVQYLSVKADKSLFRVSTENDFLENEKVVFDAQVYNESYELINDGEVSILLINSEDKEYQFTFSKTNTAFYLNAGKLPADEYRYVASTNSAGKELKETGVLTVLPIEVESLNLQADYQLLFDLSQQYGGAVFTLNQTDELIQQIKTREDIKAVSYSQTKLTDLINNKWIFFLLLALLSTEWFIRKRSGSY